MNTTFSSPMVAEIPHFDLYLPGFALCHSGLCAPISPKRDKGLTASMVNNYVKNGYLTKPDKKKPTCQQIARLIAINTLKCVFSIQEIAQTLNTLQTCASIDQLYDAFVDYMNQGIDPANPIIQTSCQTVKLYHQTRLLIDHSRGGNPMNTSLKLSKQLSFLEKRLLIA